MKKTSLKTIMAAAALGLAVGNTAQAHLGWTIKQCKAAWGEPGYTGFNSALGMTFYTFKLPLDGLPARWPGVALPDLYEQVYLVDGGDKHVKLLSGNEIKACLPSFRANSF
jgi:hypothetical protein